MLNSETQAYRKPNFKHRHIIRLGRLLNMKYTPAEIANEIGVSVDTVYRSYIPAGCPFEKDKKGLIWIVGVEFGKWAQTMLERKKRPTNPECSKSGKAWCFRCSMCVRITNAKTKPVNHHLELLQGKCEQCGGKVNRARAARKGNTNYDS